MSDKPLLPCVSLIGMPGSGKSTIGRALAKLLGWEFADCDYLIESLYAARLQDITDALGKEKFLDVECEVIDAFRASRCVIATGGSAVYRPAAIERLRGLGPLVYLRLSLDKIIKRIAANPERGIAIAPGESLNDLFEQRRPLYEKAADFVCDTEIQSPDDCALEIANFLAKKGLTRV